MTKLNPLSTCLFFQAIEKGVSITRTGFVFGVFELAVFLFSPILQNQVTLGSNVEYYSYTVYEYMYMNSF